MSRRGFTLTELLVGMVVMAVLGSALARLLISNSRFVSRQDAMADARATARAALHTMLSELHMVAENGLNAASKDSVEVIVPYAFGVACRTTSGTMIASLMPTDSQTFAAAMPDGIAWRDSSTGNYSIRTRNPTVAPSTDYAACQADSIRVVPGGSLVAIGRVGSGAPPGSLFYLYQTITYRFRPSSDLPGRLGLWRRVNGGPYVEIAAPFDTAARFAFLTGASLQADTRSRVRTAELDSVRGLELRLVGASVATPPGAAAPQRFELITKILFRNRAY
jgi:prepilin-type N-terminal cleavage/methylation domain-containing protein